jgi:hypothetical protein
MGVETWRFTLREEYLDVRGKKWLKTGEDCVIRSFVTCTLRKILLG